MRTAPPLPGGVPPPRPALPDGEPHSPLLEWLCRSLSERLRLARVECSRSDWHSSSTSSWSLTKYCAADGFCPTTTVYTAGASWNPMKTKRGQPLPESLTPELIPPAHR